jgi:hypothetical protein
MKKNGIDMVVEHWTNDGGFRRAFKADPKVAIESRGITLDDHEWQALAVLGASEELDIRVSFDGGDPTNQC